MASITTDPRFVRANERFVRAIRAAQLLPYNARKMAERAANRSLRAACAAIQRWSR